MSRHCCFIALRFILALTMHGCLLQTSVQAQTTSPANREKQAPSRGYVAQFRHELRALAQRFQVCVLAEDAPYVPVPPDSPFAAAVAEKPSEESVEPFERQLSQIAVRYDYQLVPEGRQREPGSVYLLRKRFANTGDLPDVTFEECELCAAEVAALLQNHLPNPPVSSWNNIALDIADALSPEEVAQMAKEGVPIHALNPAQHRLAERLTLEMYFGISGLKEFPKFSSYLRDVKKHGVAQLGSAKESLVFQTMFGTDSAVGVGLPGNGYNRIFRFIPCLRAKWDAREAIRQEEEYQKSVDAATVSLRQFASEMNQHTAPNWYDVVPEIAEKRVMLIGQEMVPPGRLFAAVARLLDLRIRLKKGGGQTLARFHPPPRVVLAEVYPAIVEALPPTLVRYLRLTSTESIYTHGNEVPSSTQEYDKWMRERELKDRQRRETQNRSNYLVSEAALRAGLGLKKILKNNELPFAALDVRTQRYFALRWLAEWLTSKMAENPTTIPEYVSDFESARLTGGWQGEGEKRHFSVDVTIRRPNGTFVGAGVSSEGTRRIGN